MELVAASIEIEPRARDSNNLSEKRFCTQYMQMLLISASGARRPPSTLGLRVEQDDRKRAAEMESTDHLAGEAAEFITTDRILEDLTLEERLDAMVDRAMRRLAK